MATAEINSRKETVQPVSLESLSDTLAFGVTFAITLTIVQRGVGFLRGLLFCQLMTEQELGQWSMAYSFLMLLAPLAVLGLPGSFGRFVEHYRQKGQLSSFIWRIGWVSCFLTLSFSVGMFVFAEHFSNQIFGSEGFVGVVRAMAVALLFVTANNFLSTLMESLRQVRRATLMRFATGIAFAIFGTGLIWFGDNGTWAATLGFGIACLIGMYPAVSFLIRHRNKISDTGERLTHQKMWMRIVPFAAWLWASNFVTNMFEVSDRYMLIHWSSSDVDSVHAFLGQYHSGRILPTLLVGVSAILVGMLLPYLSAHWEKQQHGEAKRLMNLSTKLMSIAFTAAGIGMVCFANVLFDVAFAGKFDEGLTVLPATSLYCIWFSVIGLLTTYLLVIEKGKQMFFIIGAGLVLNLLLNMMLIPELGLQGAVLATTLSMFLTLIVSFGMNSWQGLPIERSVIACALLPVAVVTPVPIAILIFITFTAIAVTTGLIFDELEKASLMVKIESLKQRIFG